MVLAVRETVPVEITVPIWIVTAEIFATEIVTATVTGTVTAEMAVTETVIVTGIAGVTATATGMIPDLNRDLTQGLLAAETTVAVMRKILFRIWINKDVHLFIRGNVGKTFPFLSSVRAFFLGKVDERERR